MKKILGIFIWWVLLSTVSAAEIKLVPSTGSFGDGCTIPVEIWIDTDNKTISATDVMMESSMEFLDFIPTKVFPYFLPPTVMSNTVHLIWFAVEPTQRVSWRSLLWTVYFKKRTLSDRDWAIRLYFTNAWDTIDSNLSMPWWIDILDKVNSAYYTFDGTGGCIHDISALSGWIKNVSLEAALAKVSWATMWERFLAVVGNHYLIGLLVGLIIVWGFYLAIWRKWKRRQ